MSAINIKKTDTPDPSSAGRVGIYITESGQARLIDSAGNTVPLSGNDGKEIELQAASNMLQWRYVGDVDWVNLFDLSGLSGGSSGVGPGMSLDISGNVQLGNEDAGLINLLGSLPFLNDQIRIFSQFEESGNLYSIDNYFGKYGTAIYSYFYDLIDPTINQASTFEMSSSSVYSQIIKQDGVFYANCFMQVDNGGSSVAARLRLEYLVSSDFIEIKIERDLSTLESKAIVSDTVNEKGLEDASDYSANKTENSYITPNWIKSRPGFNAAVPQNFTHDGSGGFLWVNI